MTDQERDIERRLVRLVESAGGRCLKWVSTGQSGVPDRICLMPAGRVIFVETKRPKGGRLSALQKVWHRKLVLLGFEVHVVWDADDLADLASVL